MPYVCQGKQSIQHQCDTDGGSSGTPLMDKATMHVVGIHWGSMLGTPSNHAIPMNLILDYLRDHRPDEFPNLTVVND